MTLVHPDVRATWIAFSTRFEGRVAHLYLDVKGYPTTGIGYLVPDIMAMRALPWRCCACSSSACRALLVAQSEVDAEWSRVRAMPVARVASFYRGPLRLADDVIDDLALSRLDVFADVLARSFPALATWPAPAQQGALSMAWALGPAFPASGKWPRFSAAARAQDWATCAAECAINSTGNPGIVPRNVANRALFLTATGT